jgi:hypothetical protein
MPPFQHNTSEAPAEPAAQASNFPYPSSYAPEGKLKLPLLPDGTPRLDFLEYDLGVARLNRIHKWLWLAGLRRHPRPLHQQKSESREIMLVERMDMHLVWIDNTIYLKPIPRYLLDNNSWQSSLRCNHNNHADSQEGQHLHSSKGPANSTVISQNDDCQQRKLYGCAIGFLLSYAALIQYESDFEIARSAHLLPTGVEWSQWAEFVKQLLGTEHANINPRFHYGELRLSRLNKIYRYILRQYRGYGYWYRQQSTYFQKNLAPIVSLTVYIAVVLTAMQVGLATDQLKDNLAFHRASYGFTILAIMGPIGLVGIVAVVFLLFLLDDARYALRKRKQKSPRTGLEQG